MHRFYQILLIVAFGATSWLAMMAVHEFGHVLHAWLSGGRVTAVVLNPRDFSRTDVLPNPHPFLVAWGGPLLGCLIPLVLLLAARWASWRYAYLASAFAGFCLIANGAYLAAGSFFPNGDDAGVLLRHGAAQWQLVGFGVAAISGGLFLWHGLGRHFGFAGAQGRVDPKAAIGCAIALVVVILVEVTLCR
jgi:hypothetical protein